jgi:hypothetical protein
MFKEILQTFEEFVAKSLFFVILIWFTAEYGKRLKKAKQAFFNPMKLRIMKV